MTYEPRDVKPYSPVASLAETWATDRAESSGDESFPVKLVAPVCGMAPSFVARVVGHKRHLSSADVLLLLDQDAFSETFVPRSKVLGYLRRVADLREVRDAKPRTGFVLGSALDVIPLLPSGSVQTVVTSTPYWAMRMYADMAPSTWADGETCPYGMEQTPEGFIRHSVEMLYLLLPAMHKTGSVWWNLGDTYSTRTQIRNNAAEALRAMQGKDSRGWHDHAARRYSAGHSYLKDGEQCLIPSRIAERASRIGYHVKSMISWVKTASLPEPQQSRVSRNVETIIHLTIERTPLFHREAYLSLPPVIGGRSEWETGKLSDSWILPTSNGRGGHGAQFPLALPGRCIALSSDPGDLVLDPFMGSGTTALAAERLKRRWLGIEVSSTYLEYAEDRLSRETSMLTLGLETDLGVDL